MLCLQQLQPAVDHFDLLIRDGGVILGLGSLGFQRLFLQLPDHLIQAGPTGASDRLPQPPGPPDGELELELQGLLGQPGQLAASSLELDLGLAQFLPPLEEALLPLGGLPLSLQAHPVGFAVFLFRETDPFLDPNHLDLLRLDPAPGAQAHGFRLLPPALSLGNLIGGRAELPLNRDCVSGCYQLDKAVESALGRRLGLGLGLAHEGTGPGAH